MHSAGNTASGVVFLLIKDGLGTLCGPSHDRASGIKDAKGDLNLNFHAQEIISLLMHCASMQSVYCRF
jgi:hypothetical protein